MERHSELFLSVHCGMPFSAVEGEHDSERISLNL